MRVQGLEGQKRIEKQQKAEAEALDNQAKRIKLIRDSGSEEERKKAIQIPQK